MAEDFGNGVTRTLSALARQFTGVVWQSGKPPLDSELNLMSQVDFEALRQAVRSQVHSGFFLDPARAADDFQFHESWSNFFKFGRPVEDEPHIYAAVNGMIVPVAGAFSTDLSNIIRLSPPPESDTRTDFVYLEVWRTLVAPNPSAENKPTASEIYKYGNTQFGGDNIEDDLEDPALGFETTERVQVQYRLKVFGSGGALGESSALHLYPNGLEDPNIKGQGAADSPVDGMFFHSMRDELGDPSLWRAGNGDSSNGLGTVDGYVYAIPVCAIFRRNSRPYQAVSLGGGAPQHNGGPNRNPSAALLANPSDGARVLSSAKLNTAITDENLGEILLNGLAGSGIDDPYLFSNAVKSRFLVLGEGSDIEIIEFSGADASDSVGKITVVSRGRGGTMAKFWDVGTKVSLFNLRPDGLYSDQIVSGDLLDLRRGISFGDWDFERLLYHNVAELVRGTLRTTWKTNGADGDSKGPVLHAVDYLHADGNDSDIPLHVDALDGPDGIRTIWSDAAVIQTGVTVLCDHEAPLTNNFPTSTFNHTINWDIGAGFQPTGYLNSVGGLAWKNGSVIFLHLGGEDGEGGARATFRENARAVRFVSPREWWKHGFPIVDPNNGDQHPIKIRFLNEAITETPPTGLNPTNTKKFPGPMYPWREQQFEKPFIALGGIVDEDFQVSGLVPNLAFKTSAGPIYEVDLGINFDEAGVYFPSDDSDPNDIANVGKGLLQNTRTLYDLLYDGGKDTTGSSSELYLILYGDDNAEANNGAFKIISAGQNSGGRYNASSSDRVVVEPLTEGWGGWVGNNSTVTAEVRTQFMSAEDGEGRISGKSAMAIVFTDIENIAGGEANPWNAANVGDHALSNGVESKLIISTSLMYNPSRGGTSRIADDIHMLSVMDAGNGYLRNQVSDIDTEFNGATGFPEAERHYKPTNAQLWNRLPSLGWDAPYAPHYGGRVVAQSEQDRDGELFIDRGSKTVVWRPFQRRELTIQAFNHNVNLLGGAAYLNGVARDNASIFEDTLKLGFALPPEVMPRFGRQDIPFHIRTGDGDPFLSGINHLFVDEVDETTETFCIIGGEDNQGAPGNNEVTPMLFQTGVSSGLEYCERAVIADSTHPVYQARVKKYADVISSDLGHGMEGIELPPNHGIARLYGVYERNDYISKISGDTPGGHRDDRITVIEDPPKNLLRTDVEKQTLFIRQGGGSDVTGSVDDHTYVIPSEVINFESNPNYVADKPDFADYEYVIECVVFGFARGFINKNTYVLSRKTAGTGFTMSAVLPAELEDVRMVIPCPAVLNDKAYVSYSRTPYQGDPFMTREGETQQTTDFQHRLGQVPLGDAYKLNAAIQQFDDKGVLQVQRPNARAFEVLASVDFFTTLGTGKLGGKLYPGTFYDVGCIHPSPKQSTRLPNSEDVELQRGWTMQTRAFTEGQITNTSRATVEMLCTPQYTSGLMGASHIDIEITTVDGSKVVLQGDGTDFNAGVSSSQTANSLRMALETKNTLKKTLYVEQYGSNVLRLISAQTGELGNSIKVSVKLQNPSNTTDQASDFLQLLASSDSTKPKKAFNSDSSVFMSGAEDIPVNAGAGSSQLDLTGMIERLPLGILLQDSDFLCENPMGDNASAFITSPAGIRPIQSVLPLTERGSEYTRFFGSPGEMIAMSDGAIRRYAAYEGPDTGTDTGTRRFRIYRGGGSCFNLSGQEPGGPLDWVSDSLPASLKPVLKGGVLACKAMLVRNFYEEAYASEDKMKRSDGDEIQMVILTYGVLGDGHSVKHGVEISGEISPTGFGEGYAAADRYLIEGRPMLKGRRRDAPDPTVEPTPFSKEDA